MNADERRRIEREVKEYNRNKKEFESRKDEGLVSKTLGAAGKVVKSAAIIGGGFFIARKGWKEIGRPAAKDFLGSKNGSKFVSTVNKRLDDMSITAKAFNETAKSTGLINTISGKSNREFASKIAYQSRKQSLKPNGMLSIKSNIEKVASEYANMREEIMYRSIRGVQKDEFAKTVQRNAERVNLSKKDKGILDNAMNAINSQYDTYTVKDMFSAAKTDGQSASKKASRKNFLDQVLENAYKNKKTGELPSSIFTENGKIPNNIKELLVNAMEEVETGNDFMKKVIGAHEHLKIKKGSDNFLKKSGVVDEINARYNNVISAYNSEIGHMLNKEDGNIKQLLDKGIKAVEKKDYRIKNVIDEVRNMENDVGLRPMTIREAKQRNLLDYEVVGSKAHVDKENNRIITETINMSNFIDDLESSVSKDGISIMDSVFDKNVYINDVGEIVDLRAPKSMVKNVVNSFADNVQVPFLNFNPVKLLRDMFTAPSDMPVSTIFKSGEYMPALNMSKSIITVGDDVVEKTMGLVDDNYYFNGKIFDNKGNFVKEGYLYNADRGLPKNVYNQLIDNEEKRYHNSVFKLLDLGNQNERSAFGRVGSVLGKFKDPDWQPNMLLNIDKATELSKNYEYANRAFKSFYTTSLNASKPLTGQQLESLRPMLNDVFGDEDFINNLILGSTDQNVMDSITYLINDANPGEQGKMFLGKLKTIQKSYMENPEKFVNSERTRVLKQEEWSPALLDSIKPSKYDNISAIDEAKIFIHAEVLNRVEKRLTTEGLQNGKSLYRAYEDSIDQITMATGDLAGDDVKPLMSLSFLQNIANDGKYIQGDDISKEYLDKFLNAMHGTSETEVQGATGVLRDVINKNNSVLDYGPDDISYNRFSSSDYIFVGKAEHGASSTLSEINSRITMGENPIEATLGTAYGNASGYMNELGFGGANRAGRDNLEAMTRSGMVSYQMASRLNTMLSQAGIGLSSASMGSAQEIWSNLALKRIVAPMAIGGYAIYANDFMGQITGEKPTQTVGEAYANITVGMSGLKEMLGINTAFEGLNRLMPGADRVFETPVGMAAETLTAGLIGNSRSGSEQVEYLTSGKESVRKGRWWSIGSNTPLWGDRIKYWQPTWYQRLMSDYKYTDTYYGEGMERWRNSVLPTLHNPLGGLNPLTWNHYAEKHYDDRPYPIKRSMFANIPIVGDALDATVGRITTPFRKRSDLGRQHEEYLKEINMLTAYYGTSQVATHMEISPGGRMTPVTVTPQVGGTGVVSIDGKQEPINASYVEGQPGLGLISGEIPMVSAQGFIEAGADAQAGTITGVGVGAGYPPQVGQGAQFQGRVGSGAAQARSMITAINQNYTTKSKVNKVNVGAIASLKDSDFVDDLDSVSNPNSLTHSIGRTIASIQETEGIYGWMSGFVTGDVMPKTVLASSNNMMSMARTFWDNEMGGTGFGLPGAEGLSELYRRFIPRPYKGQKAYNPIRNTMPDWLPGPEYFTDFKHGDPYAKVPKGEIRLPGEAYESVNHLHSDDIFGRYGAVDRMLILSDIAPYSQQYDYYKKVTSRMRENKMIDDDAWEEIQGAKDRVRETKKKYDFHPYKFKTANVNRETVTVTKVLDDNTFMVDTMPGTPLKLAGLGKLPKGNTGDKASRIRELIHDQIRAGDKITVGIAQDEMNAYNSDTKGTMDAVVYMSKDRTLNREIATIAGEKMFGFEEESPIEVKWDSDGATDVAALYSTSERKFGSAWESFSHMNTPFHTKFLQIRSPLEMYKRKELYGKSWQSWDNPIQDWIVPTMNTMTQANPIVAAGAGSLFGYLAGTNKYAKAVGATIGAVVGGGASSIRTVGEAAARMYNAVVPNALEIRDTYIPKRRQTQRYINEYFDKLKYVKYMGLYEKTRNLAIENEGVDPQALIEANKLQSQDTKNKRRVLNLYKKMNGLEGLQSEHNKVLNEALNILDGKKSVVSAGKYTMQALDFYDEAMTTVYGVDPYGDVSKIYAALPKKDKPFYQEFLKAGPKEREEILRLVPEDQKKFYQAAWGMDVDKQESVEEFFMKNYLPDASWEGWASDVSIDDIKIKFLDKVGQELSEYGYWKDDIYDAQSAPNIPRGTGGLKQGNPLNVSELYKVLNGMGVSSADIQAEVEYSTEPFASPVEISMALEYDRRQDVRDGINNFLPDLLGGR